VVPGGIDIIFVYNYLKFDFTSKGMCEVVVSKNYKVG